MRAAGAEPVATSSVSFITHGGECVQQAVVLLRNASLDPASTFAIQLRERT